MGQRWLVRWSVILVALLVVVGGGWPAYVGAAAGVPPGYQRVPVKEAGISILVPDTWEITAYTRKQAQAMLDANPQLAEQGATVDDILKSPFNDAGIGMVMATPTARWMCRSIRIQNCQRSCLRPSCARIF
jgi:hypothetical protein